MSKYVYFLQDREYYSDSGTKFLISKGSILPLINIHNREDYKIYEFNFYNNHYFANSNMSEVINEKRKRVLEVLFGNPKKL